VDTAAVPSEDEDGSFLHVSVRNSLPCVSAYYVLESILSYYSHKKPLPANEIVVSFSGRESEKLRFCAEVEALEPGTSTFRLFCPVCLSSRSFRTRVIYSIQVFVVGDLCFRTNRSSDVKSPSAVESPNNPQELQQNFTDQACYPHSSSARKGYACLQCSVETASLW
jgi:hypothetical protein